jgi:hypothetical protein
MKCTLICEKNVYPWAIGEYIEKFSTSYLKLETLRVIIGLYNENMIFDENVFIKNRNINIYNRIDKDNIKYSESYSSIINISNERKNEYFLFGKYESPEMFWNIFENNSKPDVYIKDKNKYFPILEMPESKLVFNKVEVNSPPLFEITGAVGSLIDLFYANEREDRKRIEFSNEMIGQSVENLEKIVRTNELIEKSSTSNGFKEYTSHQLAMLMEKQNIINQKLGVNLMKINEYA